MPIHAQMSPDSSQATIAIDGRFDFSQRAEFTAAYRGVDSPRTVEFIVDLSRTEYVDSSALGMLLLLREFAGGDGSKIILKNCSGEVKRILQVSNFHSLFRVD